MIVLTGGPRAERWLIVPEAAPLLFQAGLDGRKKRFQGAVVRLQMALEAACADPARPGQVLLCHRGTFDPLAYWLRSGWDEEEFFVPTEMSREGHLGRYTGVIHLQTAALGTEADYRRWPDAHRPETAAQAAEIDRLCVRAWGAHPGYILIDNDGRDWAGKALGAREALFRVIVYRPVAG